MKNVKILIGSIFIISIFACNNAPEEIKEKTTVIGTVNLVTAYNGGWWNSDINDQRLQLSNLLPNGIIKNNSNYEITVSGSSNVIVDQFQIVLSSLAENNFNWVDLAPPSEKISLQVGNFSKTVTFTTTSEATVRFNNSWFAFTNEAPGSGEDGVIKAILSNVSIKIVEK